jgi:hypothetical protein
MKKEPVLGLAGLILTGVLGCQMNRPYYSRYTPVQNHFAPAETPYRPKTVVTMRAEEVPENSTPASACPAVQVVGATATPVAPAPSQAAGSSSMVTVTIPAMKIVIPMTATVATPSAKEAGTVTQLPPAVGSVVQASGAVSITSSSSSSKASEPEPHPAIHVQKEEAVSTPSTTTNPTSRNSTSTTSSAIITESPPLPEPIPESKPKTKSTKKDNDPARLPKLSLLPPDPPPDFPAHRTNAPGKDSRMTEPPPPPPIPKSSSSSSGPILPSEDLEPREP